MRLPGFYPPAAVLLLLAGSACVAPDEVGTEAAPAEFLVRAGEFEKIYDPSAGEERPWYVNDHCFIHGPGGWHLYGITHEEPPKPLEETILGHATADSLADGPWRKQPFVLEADWDRWREVHLWAPHVVRHQGLFHMFYAAGSPDRTRNRIHLATSPDLQHWTRHEGNPVVVDGYGARDPFLLGVDGRWVMYYTATSSPKGGAHVVAYRTSDDLVHWDERKIAYRDAREGTSGGPTESPFVVQRGDWYYLFLGPRDGDDYDYRRLYRGTDVLRSRDPFHWRAEDRVGHLAAHAPEVIRDTDGLWYVSHCGWGEGGVYLAPLHWEDGLDDAETSLPAPGRG